jgi:hypothetical protein
MVAVGGKPSAAVVAAGSTGWVGAGPCAQPTRANVTIKNALHLPAAASQPESLRFRFFII